MSRFCQINTETRSSNLPGTPRASVPEDRLPYRAVVRACNGATHRLSLSGSHGRSGGSTAVDVLTKLPRDSTWISAASVPVRVGENNKARRTQRCARLLLSGHTQEVNQTTSRHW